MVYKIKQHFLHFLHDNFHLTKHQSTYLKQNKGVKQYEKNFLTTKANSSEQDMI